MHFSAILVLSPPEHFSRCLEALAVLPGVEIHHTDQESGRAIVVQESETLQGQEESLRRIQRLPAVMMAELVYHYPGTGEAEPPEGQER